MDWTTVDGTWRSEVEGYEVIVFRCGKHWRLMIGASISPTLYESAFWAKSLTSKSS
jgi:hypothetical protein